MNKLNFKTRLFYFIGSLALFFMSLPYFVWHNAISSLSFLFIVGIAIKHVYNNPSKALNKSIWVILFFILSIWNSLVSFSDLNFLGIITSLMVPLLWYVAKIHRIIMIRIFIDIYSFLLFLSVISYLLVISGIRLPYSSIQTLNVLKDFSYNAYPFFVIQDNMIFDIYRFMAFFDEPGVLGTLNAILLLLFSKKMKIWNYVILLISGLISFSFYFYVTYFVFIFFKFILNRKLKNIAFIIGVFSVLVAVFYFTNDYLKDRLAQRFEITETGEISGDNRVTDAFAAEYNDFIFTKDLFFGRGNSVASLGSSSYKTLIYSRGLIFFLLICGMYVMYAIKRIENKKELLIFLWLFGSFVYQRPFLFSPFYFFILITGIDYISSSDKFLKLVPIIFSLKKNRSLVIKRKL